MDAPGPIPFRPIPFHAAQAYGMRSGARDSAARDAQGRIQPPLARAADRTDRVSASLAELVSGSVKSPVSRGAGFDAPQAAGPRGQAPGAPLTMYTRAADRIEVATQVTVGRTLDTRG